MTCLQSGATLEARRASRLNAAPSKAALTGQASRFAQLVQQVSVPSYMQSTSATSARRPSTLERAPPSADAALDVLAKIGTSIWGSTRNRAGGQAQSRSGAGEILAMLEASLEIPTAKGLDSSAAASFSPQRPDSRLAADELTEIDNLLSGATSPGMRSAQPALVPDQTFRADSYAGNGAYRQSEHANMLSYGGTAAAAADQTTVRSAATSAAVRQGARAGEFGVWLGSGWPQLCSGPGKVDWRSRSL